MHLAAAVAVMAAAAVMAENIDPYDDGSKYAYGENVGWVNFDPNEPSPGVGATVGGEKVTGLVWCGNIGWINLDPADSDPDTGVVNDGAGNLSGYAWAENAGWINFNPTVPGDLARYGVTIDPQGYFSGWAWGENIGWIKFGLAQPVRACKVAADDLANFADQWLVSGDSPADLRANGQVDFEDYGALAAYWLDYCPDDWPLK
jgi:hypothetical protein